MKKVFNKSYKLGITAGIISGVIYSLFYFAMLPVYTPVFYPEYLTAFSSFLLFLFISIFFSILSSSLFIAVINVIPTKNIVSKFFIFNTAMSVLSLLPMLFFETGKYFNNLTPYNGIGIVLYNVFDFFIYPMLFCVIYIFLCKKFIRLARASTGWFTFIISLLLLVMFIASIVSISVDTYQYAKKEKTSILQKDMTATELDVFDKINHERQLVGLKELSWDNKVYHAAKKYSEEIALSGVFAHTSSNGKTPVQRLKDEDIFFFSAAENLAGRSSYEKDLSHSFVSGWMDSPGHRSTIIDPDGMYSDAAVGVSCNALSCFAVMDFISSTVERTIDIGPDDVYHFNLNDDSLGLGMSYPVRIDIESSAPVDIYLFDNIEQIALFIDHNEDWSQRSFHRRKEFHSIEDAKKDSYLVLLTSGNKTADVHVRMEYNKEELVSSLSSR